MLQKERRLQIVSMLQANGVVRLKDLREQFAVSDDSIRKDLDVLEEQGLLERTYGGAVAKKDALCMLSATLKKGKDVSAKRQLALAAANIIGAQDMVFLDVSTSNLAIAELLAKSDRELTVATNMIDILAVLAKNPRLRVIFAGGVLNKRRDGFWGPMTADFIAKLKPDIAFVGAVSVSVAKNSVATYDVEDGLSKAAIIKLAKRAYVVATTEKLNGSEGNYNYAALTDFTGIVTDAAPSAAFDRAARQMGVSLLFPQVEGADNES